MMPFSMQATPACCRLPLRLWPRRPRQCLRPCSAALGAAELGLLAPKLHTALHNTPGKPCSLNLHGANSEVSGCAAMQWPCCIPIGGLNQDNKL